MATAHLSVGLGLETQSARVTTTAAGAQGLSSKGVRNGRGRVTGFRRPFTTRAVATTVEESKKSDSAAVVVGARKNKVTLPDEYVQSLATALKSQSVDGGAEGTLAGQKSLAVEGLRALRWPTSKDEAYRFTNLSELKALKVEPASRPGGAGEGGEEAKCTLSVADNSRVVLVDGFLDTRASNLTGLPDGVVAGCVGGGGGGAAAVAAVAAKHFGSATAAVRADLFTEVNGAGAADVFVLHVAQGVKMSTPIHVVHRSTGTGAGSGSVRLSCPRCLVVLEEGAEASLVEEFVGPSGVSYWTNQVTEVVLAPRAVLTHELVQQQALAAFHMKQTAVLQGEQSRYCMVEVNLGARLARHNLHVQQVGPDTETELSTFLLVGSVQTHDLHSSLVLDHPRGRTRQLHKCIVADPNGRGVFDGNVRVNRYAQQTDAGQLSRNLLLYPRSTVNVKPNLQIVADDVRCTHGATISDLEEDQLFYFRARGIDAASARSALVLSFGAEVMGKLQEEQLRKRVEVAAAGALAAGGAVDAAVVAAVRKDAV